MIEAIVAAVEAYSRGGYDVVVDGIVGPWFLPPLRALATDMIDGAASGNSRVDTGHHSRGWPQQEVIMQFVTPEDTPSDEADPQFDHALVTALHDHHLRGLLVTAAGLSTESLLRVGAAAETLRRTEGLHPLGLTAQL
ncbi:hypothetical protein ACIO52_20645 [Nocardia sp. NPDC087230]|uniref:hypothetical protein n=1 Tax=Nocardia sp. NPDC087230 TaxID=3364331 RepID=UPI0037F98B9A